MYDELVKWLRSHYCGVHAKAFKDAADAIEELSEERDMYTKAMADEHNRAARLAWEHRWIPVTERLPDENDVVLITDSLDVGTGYLIHGYGWISPFDDIDTSHVTHWMPLPEPPDVET